MIPYGKHFLDENDINAVVKVLRSGNLTQGPLITEFETAFSKYVGCKYSVAVSSCTAGLHLAAITAGMQSGDTLVTSPITFVSSANASQYVGGNVVFTDVDDSTINMEPSSLKHVLSKHPKTKVVVPVHFAGLPCDMSQISSICNEANVCIVEDAAHALGATYENGKKVGSCCFSLMTVFSLHPVKAIAAGEGGVITTNDEDVYRRLLRLRSHGINKLDDSFLVVDEAHSDSGVNPWYYEMQELGFHYRITDIQCALALSQLSKIDKFIRKRREIAKLYYKHLSGMSNIKPAQPEGILTDSAWHIFVVRIDFEAIGMDRRDFMLRLKEFNILTQVHYIPVPMQPYYLERGISITDSPHAEEYYRECLSLPTYYSLSRDDQMHVIDTITSLLT